jgi:hypothetical protein
MVRLMTQRMCVASALHLSEPRTPRDFRPSRATGPLGARDFRWSATDRGTAFSQFSPAFSSALICLSSNTTIGLGQTSGRPRSTNSHHPVMICPAPRGVLTQVHQGEAGYRVSRSILNHGRGSLPVGTEETGKPTCEPLTRTFLAFDRVKDAPASERRIVGDGRNV